MNRKNSIRLCLALLTLSIFVSGCAATEPKVIVEYETVEVVRTVTEPVDPALVEPVEVVELPPDYLEMSDGDAALATGAAYKACKVRTMQCNGKLQAISEIGKEENEDE